jgi:hypothetical protein
LFAAGGLRVGRQHEGSLDGLCPESQSRHPRFYDLIIGEALTRKATSAQEIEALLIEERSGRR